MRCRWSLLAGVRGRCCTFLLHGPPHYQLAARIAVVRISPTDDVPSPLISDYQFTDRIGNPRGQPHA